MEKYHNPHGQLKENLFLPLFNTNFISTFFDGPLHNSVARTWGKARDILILERITDFSTTGSAGLKHRNNGRNMNIQVVFPDMLFFDTLVLQDVQFEIFNDLIRLRS